MLNVPWQQFTWRYNSARDKCRRTDTQIYRRGNGKVILGPAGRAFRVRPAGKKIQQMQQWTTQMWNTGGCPSRPISMGSFSCAWLGQYSCFGPRQKNISLSNLLTTFLMAILSWGFEVSSISTLSISPSSWSLTSLARFMDLQGIKWWHEAICHWQKQKCYNWSGMLPWSRTKEEACTTWDDTALSPPVLDEVVKAPLCGVVCFNPLQMRRENINTSSISIPWSTSTSRGFPREKKKTTKNKTTTS